MLQVMGESVLFREPLWDFAPIRERFRGQEKPRELNRDSVELQQPNGTAERFDQRMQAASERRGLTRPQRSMRGFYLVMPLQKLPLGTVE